MHLRPDLASPTIPKAVRRSSSARRSHQCAWEHVHPKKPSEPLSTQMGPQVRRVHNPFIPSSIYTKLTASGNSLLTFLNWTPPKFEPVALACSEADDTEEQAPSLWFFLHQHRQRPRASAGACTRGPGPHTGPAGGSPHANTPSAPPKAFRFENINTDPSPKLKLI